MLNAVLFDLDNTLVDRERAFSRCLEAVFSDPTVRAKLVAADARGHGNRAQLLHAWERHGGGALGLAELGERIAQNLNPDPELVSSLQALAESLQLGLISNGGSRVQRSKLRTAGLDSVFPKDRVWISEEVGLAKPDARLFLLASRHLGVAPGSCLYLGDHEPHDVAGPRSVGMRARLVDSVLNSEYLKRVVGEELFQ